MNDRRFKTRIIGKTGLIFSGSIALVLLVAACSSSSAKFDKDEPPVGGTPTEFGFQYAQAIAKNGNCDQALPILVCLGEQGPGWELAVHSGGLCALEAAKLWTGPLQTRPGFFNKRSRVSFEEPYYQSKTALRDKGLSLLHRSAEAGWPDSQAVLVKVLSAPGNSDANVREAKLWLARYDLNPRRKIYGSNTIDPAVRARLASIEPASKTGPKWISTPLVQRPPRGPFCRQLIRARPSGQSPNAHGHDEPQPGALPEPETVDGPRQRPH